MERNALTAEIVRELLDYDPVTGDFTWKWRSRKWFDSDANYRRWNTRWAGKPAFSANGGHGYLEGRILTVKYKAHRVAWLYVHGHWPSPCTDHINHDKQDNRISNLREVDDAENAKNKRTVPANTSGQMGVVWHKQRQKWQARIKIGRKLRSLGLFDDKEEAIRARKDAEWVYGFHENHGID